MKRSEKRCNGCDIIRPLTDFYHDKTKPDKHHCRCKYCRYPKKWKE